MLNYPVIFHRRGVLHQAPVAILGSVGVLLMMSVHEMGQDEVYSFVLLNRIL